MSLLLFSSLLPAALPFLRRFAVRCLASFAAVRGLAPFGIFCYPRLTSFCGLLAVLSTLAVLLCFSLLRELSGAEKRGGCGRISGSVAAASLRRLPSFFSLLANLPGRKRDVAAGLADALPLLPFVACSPLGCPVAFVPLERSCRSEKKEVALPLLPFAVRLPSSRWKGRQDGRGRYCLFATFSSSPSPSPAAPFASLPGRKGPLRRAGFGSVSTAPLRRLPSFFALPANLPGRKRGVATG